MLQNPFTFGHKVSSQEEKFIFKQNPMLIEEGLRCFPFHFACMFVKGSPQ